MPFTGPFEDRLAIRELAERYCDGINRFDADVWGSTWAEDGAWFHANVRTEGRDKIVASWLESMEPFEATGFFCQMAGIQVDGNSATGRVYNHQIARRKDGQIVQGVYIYDDTYVKRDGRWLFKERLLTVPLFV